MAYKHLLYLTNQQMTAVRWKNGIALSERVFAVDEHGVDSFADYFEQAGFEPTYLLTDLVEEDYRLDSVPHVGLRDRRAVLERRLQQIYRATPYRLASVQGRGSEGRRDDHVLYSAITNPNLLRPWVDVLEHARAPLAGVYSVSLLAERLLKLAKVNAKHALLVTLETGAGLRQSYCQNGRVRFSRLTPLSVMMPVSMNTVMSLNLGTHIANEVRKTWQYLDSLSSFEAGGVLEVHIVCHEQDRSRWQGVLTDAPDLKFTLHDIALLAQHARSHYAPTDSDAAALYVHLLGQDAPRVQFASARQTRYALLRHVRLGLLAASVAIVAGAGVWGAINVVEGQLLRKSIATIEADSQRARGQQAATVASFPTTPVPAETMNEAVTFYDRVVRPSPNFGAFVIGLSKVLDEFPQVRLDQIVWATDTTNSIDLQHISRASQNNTQEAVSSRDGASPAPPDASGGGYFQAAIIEAAIDPFNSDYRAALAEIARLRAALSQPPRVTVASMVLPLNTDTENRLRGSATPEKAVLEARFALRLLVAPSKP